MNVSRRSFLRSAAASAPFLIGGCATTCAPRKIGPNQKVNVAIIGCGRIARYTNLPGFLRDPRCRVTIACDMVRMAPDYFYGARGSNFGSEGFNADGSFRKDICGSAVIKALVDKAYGDHACREVMDWREVIDDPTVDAVAICTPDHWHAIISIAAMKAGKHVFCQKPMSTTIGEGRAMARVAKETGCVFQCGNQGSSDPNYRLVEEIVANGYAGKIKGATVCISGGDHWKGHGRSTARMPLPKYFNRETWDLWQGPARHWEDDAYIPSIHDPTCWRFNDRYGSGMVADFGAHEFDMLQRGLNTQFTGPVAVENVTSDYATGTDREVFSWPGEYAFDFVYANGVRCHVRTVDEKAGFPRQMTLHCEAGDFSIHDNTETTKVPESFKNFKESDLKSTDYRPYRPNPAHDAQKFHESDFLDGILENRAAVASTCEMGCRTITMAHIANICIRLQLKGLRWDPAAERFTGAYADEANRFIEKEYHNGWELGA